MRQITSTNFIRIDNHKEIDIPIMMQEDRSKQEDNIKGVIRSHFNLCKTSNFGK